jgi:hypothetical protein
MRGEVQASLTGGGPVLLWADNYNKRRYARNPNEERDRTVNGTAACVLGGMLRGAPPSSWAFVKTMFLARIGAAVCTTTLHRCFTDDIKTTLLSGLTFDDVRVPCDLRRYGVRSLPWRPFDIVNTNIGSTTGLCSVLEHILAAQRTVQEDILLLGDINVFYRVVKFVYSRDTQHFNLRAALAGVTPCFGVWHAYAHCVKRVHQVFLPWWTALEYNDVLSRKSAFNKFKLLTPTRRKC